MLGEGGGVVVGPHTMLTCVYLGGQMVSDVRKRVG
jgi:hypothetical protein